MTDLGLFLSHLVTVLVDSIDKFYVLYFQCCVRRIYARETSFVSILRHTCTHSDTIFELTMSEIVTTVQM